MEMKPTEFILISKAEPLHPEKRLVRGKTGVYQQTKHVKSQSVPKPSTVNLTLMTMMQRFSTPEAARDYFEQHRWPNGPVCPHCGSIHAHKLTANPKKKIRPGLYFCADCRQTFTVTVGTVMEDSHVPMNKWLLAFYMMCASKTQVSALQLQRQLGIGSYSTALFMCHRVRVALAEAVPEFKLKGTVEVDETYLGGKSEGKGPGYVDNKTPVVSMVERGGKVKSVVVDNVTSKIIQKLLDDTVDPEAHLNTDESQVYTTPGRYFASHQTVNHGENQYAWTDKKTGEKVTTNTAEGFFGNTKNSIRGTHHAISPQHTDLYLGEIDYKYNTRKMTDSERTAEAVPQIEGKRMTKKQMYNRRHRRNVQPVAKAVDAEDDEMRMPAAEFDSIMERIFKKPDQTAKPKPSVREILKPILENNRTK